MSDIVTVVRARVVELLADLEPALSDSVLARVDALPYVDDESYLVAFQLAMAEMTREAQARLAMREATAAKARAEHERLMQFFGSVTSDSIH